MLVKVIKIMFVKFCFKIGWWKFLNGLNLLGMSLNKCFFFVVFKVNYCFK